MWCSGCDRIWSGCGERWSGCGAVDVTEDGVGVVEWVWQKMEWVWWSGYGRRWSGCG